MGMEGEGNGGEKEIEESSTSAVPDMVLLCAEKIRWRAFPTVLILSICVSRLVGTHTRRTLVVTLHTVHVSSHYQPI